MLDITTINYLEKEIELLDISINCKHHPVEGLNKFYDNIKFHKIYNSKEKAENIINTNDIVIFDVISHTVIYFCLYHKIRFIILFNADNYIYLTEEMKIWINYLHNDNSVFYTHEKNKLNSYLSKYTNEPSTTY